MSEKINATPETHRHNPEHAETREDTKEAHVEKARLEQEQAKMLEEARSEASKESTQEDTLLKEIKKEESETEANKDSVAQRPPDAQLKRISFDKEIKNIRKKLSSPDRLGSRVIHQPVIREISKVSAKTITRPSGLLGGGITAFIGTSAYLLITKYVGLTYNYSVFLFLLVVGFVLGLFFEAIIRLFRKRKSA